VPPGAKMCLDGVVDMVLLEMGVRVARWNGLSSVVRRFIGRNPWDLYAGANGAVACTHTTKNVDIRCTDRTALTIDVAPPNDCAGPYFDFEWGRIFTCHQISLQLLELLADLDEYVNTTTNMAMPPKKHVAESLLQRAYTPDTANTIFRERVKQRPLLLRPTSPDPAQTARAKRQYERMKKQRAQQKSKKSKPLSAKQKRSLSVYEIPKEQRKYEIYEPLHKMWCTYMRDILGLTEGKRTNVEAQDAGPFLVSADYHGAMVEVMRSRCTSRVGLTGIVVKDTKFTFEIVTKEDVVKTCPKEHTVFRLKLPLEEEGKRPLEFEILGSMFEQRAPDRANKKYRLHLDADL
jgi:ribonuclease P protein subunit POP4